MVASRWPQRLPFLAAAIRRSISRAVRYSRVRTSELTVFGAARQPARFSTIFPQRWNATGELWIILSSVPIHAARYSASLSLRRHTQPLPARRTFFAPIERSARAWLTICVAVGRRPAWTISGRAHSVSIGVVASPSWALKQNLTPRCNRPPSAGPRQRRRLFNLAIFLHFRACWLSVTEIFSVAEARCPQSASGRLPRPACRLRNMSAAAALV
jgi:hypothetical protein